MHGLQVDSGRVPLAVSTTEVVLFSSSTSRAGPNTEGDVMMSIIYFVTNTLYQNRRFGVLYQ